ncbi:MAG TPA: hypothetical protein ENJ43_01365 [Gammaproteobacteria bacterium]|nr:hypothetical protein [Gammaproteobacteria bacterium]
MTRIVIQKEPERDHPWRRRAVVVLAVVVALITCWSVFEYGRYRAGYDGAAMREMRQKLEQTNAGLEKELNRLREENSNLEQSSRIESQAYAQVRAHLARLQDEILELKQELAFYRSIVSPEDKRRGLQIQRFTLNRSSVERLWRYRLVLTRVLNNGAPARGTVDLTVEGEEAGSGNGKQLALSSISVPRIRRLGYNFKYFQNIEGELEIPEGFVPERVVLVLNPGGKGNQTRIRKVFDWPDKGRNGVGSVATGGTSDVGKE